ncbi:MAG: DUF748 domain-containing protein [Thermodesulfobacteriota bacterium]
MREKQNNRAGFSGRHIVIIIAAAAAISVAAALLIALPYGIRHYLRQALIVRGALVAVVEDVDLNPFTGRLLIHKITVKAGGAVLEVPEIAMRLHWGPLFQRRLYMESVTLRDAVFSAANADDLKKIRGVITGDGRKANGPGSSWLFGVGELRLVKSEIRYHDRTLRHEIKIKTLKLRGLREWQPEKAAAVDLDALVNNGKAVFHGRTAPFSKTPSLSGRLKVRGLSIEAFSQLAAPRIKGLKGVLAADVTLKVVHASAGKVAFAEQGLVTIKDLHASMDDTEISGAEVVWEGLFEPSGSAEAVMTGRGSLSLKGLSLDIIDNMGRAVEGAGLKTSIEGGNNINEARKNHFFSAASAIAEGVELKSSGDLRAKTLTFEKADLLLHRGSDGHWSMPARTASGAEKNTVKAGKTTLAIEEVRLSKESLIRYKDENVKPFYETTLKIRKGVIKGLDSAATGRKSAFTLEGSIAKYTKVSLIGTATPFAKSPALEITGDIKDLDLPPLSPYTSSAGYVLASGHMDAGLSMKIEKGVIDGTNKLVLKNPEFKIASGGLAGSVKKKVGSFPDAVLDLLRDRKDNISVNLPVHGDISDPEFKLNDVILKALSGAFMKSGFSYLKYYFQPWGTYITVGQLALKLAGEVVRVRLDPVFFDARSSAVKEGDMGYIEKVASLMKEKPRIRVKICGHAVTEDGEGADASEEALLKLALERSTLIQDQLVERYAVSPEAIFICRPEIDRAEEARPRVELLI